MTPRSTTVWFVRHAESEANVSNTFASRVIDPPLSVKGRNDARLIAEVLAAEHVSSLLASPLLRSKQTAEIIAHRCGLRVVFLSELEEVNVGILDGKSQLAPDNVRIHGDIVSRWSRGESEARFQGGESLAEVWERGKRVLGVLSNSPTYGRVVVVTHAFLLMAILPLLLREFPPQLERYHVPRGSITRAVMSDRLARIETLGSIEHLHFAST